jgi:hypothetical protein
VQEQSPLCGGAKKRPSGFLGTGQAPFIQLHDGRSKKFLFSVLMIVIGLPLGSSNTWTIFWNDQVWEFGFTYAGHHSVSSQQLSGDEMSHCCGAQADWRMDAVGGGDIADESQLDDGKRHLDWTSADKRWPKERPRPRNSQSSLGRVRIKQQRREIASSERSTANRTEAAEQTKTDDFANPHRFLRDFKAGLVNAKRNSQHSAKTRFRGS